MTQPPYGDQSPYQDGYQEKGPAPKNTLPMLLAGLIAVVGLAVAVVIVVVGKSSATRRRPVRESFIAQISFSGNGLNDGSISIVGTLVAVTFTQ